MTEYNVLAVQKLTIVARNKELAAVGIGARVGHGKQSSLRVLHGKVLILKLFAIDTHRSGTVALQEVASLDHEVLDHSILTLILCSLFLLAHISVPVE